MDTDGTIAPQRIYWKDCRVFELAEARSQGADSRKHKSLRYEVTGQGRQGAYLLLDDRYEKLDRREEAQEARARGWRIGLKPVLIWQARLKDARGMILFIQDSLALRYVIVEQLSQSVRETKSRATRRGQHARYQEV